MPNGYTSKIADGISFQEFVMECARGMGACITLRDDPRGEIPESFLPSDFYLKSASDAKANLNNVLAMSEEDCSRAAHDAWVKSRFDREQYIQKKIELRKKYNAMLDRVCAWIPPTADHLDFKKFMIDQIRISIDSDCNEKHYMPDIILKTGDEWKRAEVSELREKIRYSLDMHAKEVRRAEERTQWIQALRKSLKKDSSRQRDNEGETE